jgi:hypothetical protein
MPLLMPLSLAFLIKTENSFCHLFRWWCSHRQPFFILNQFSPLGFLRKTGNLPLVVFSPPTFFCKNIDAAVLATDFF